MSGRVPLPLRLSGLIAVTVLLWIVTASQAKAGPSAELWPRWQVHETNSAETVDHSAWGQFLDRYLIASAADVNRFDYAGVSREDRDRLRDYLSMLESTDVDALDRDEQYAYWLNFYNALTIDVVLDHMPVDSIREINISPGWFTRGPWGAELATVKGEALTLDDIEHRILRPIWQDPRIHFGVNCASIGCPDLLPEPFTAGNTDAMLDAAASAFINHPRGARVENGRLHVSSIFTWYMEDFGGSDAGVIRYLRRYADETLAANLEGVTRISGNSYDWSLNAPD